MSRFILNHWPVLAIGLPIVVSVFFDFFSICLEFIGDIRRHR